MFGDGGQQKMPTKSNREGRQDQSAQKAPGSGVQSVANDHQKAVLNIAYLPAIGIPVER